MHPALLLSICRALGEKIHRHPGDERLGTARWCQPPQSFFDLVGSGIKSVFAPLRHVLSQNLMRLINVNGGRMPEVLVGALHASEKGLVEIISPIAPNERSSKVV